MEAFYRFPLPGDAAVTQVRVTFGDVEIKAELKERQKAEADYEEAKRQGRQAALATRESFDPGLSAYPKSQFLTITLPVVDLPIHSANPLG